MSGEGSYAPSDQFDRQSRTLKRLTERGVSVCKAVWSRERITRVEMSWETFEALLRLAGSTALMDELDAQATDANGGTP